MNKDYLTLREAAKVLGVHYNTIGRYVKNKEIPSLRIGKSIYIPKDFAKNMTVSPGGKDGAGSNK